MRSAAETFRIGLALLAAAASAPARADSELLFYDSPSPTAPARPGIGTPKGDRIETGFSNGYVRPFRTFLKEKRTLKQYIGNDLKDDVIAFLRSDELHGLLESTPHRWAPFSTIPLGDFIADLRASPFVTSGHCRDATKSRDGTAALGDRNGEVCIAPKKLIARENFWFLPAKKAYLYGLAIHEVLHHFGYWDADDSLYGLFSALAYEYLTKQLPAPSRVKVSDDFRAWREEVREGDLPETHDGSAVLSGCRLEILEDAMNPFAYLEIVPKLREYFEGDLKITSSPGLDENVLLVSGKFVSSKQVSFPQVLKRSTLPGREAWIFNPLRVEDGTSSYLVARKASNGGVVFEIGNLDGATRTTVMLPSVFTSDLRPYGYARCHATFSR